MPDERPSPTYFGAPPRPLAVGLRAAARVPARLRMFAAFAVRLARTWVRTAREIVALQIERYRLGRSRRTLQYELGGAVLAQDEPLVADLRRRLQVCIEERERLGREARTVVARARSTTTEERSAIAPTEIRRAE
jgi:hypothetical protein